MFDPNAWQMPTYYNSSKSNLLRYKFNNFEKIPHNFSQCYQDMFVISCLDGKTGGTYVEIGSGDPFVSNNTALLESQFNWKGVSLEIKSEDVEKFYQSRKNLIAQGDATEVDYTALFEEVKLGPVFDYLQVDCEPPIITFAALKKIPLEQYKFAVITFEHDYYNHSEDDENHSVRDESRKYLEQHGYELVVNNISVDNNHPFEDWWAHPDLVDSRIISKMKCISEETKKAEDYMLSGGNA